MLPSIGFSFRNISSSIRSGVALARHTMYGPTHDLMRTIFPAKNKFHIEYEPNCDGSFDLVVEKERCSQMIRFLYVHTEAHVCLLEPATWIRVDIHQRKRLEWASGGTQPGSELHMSAANILLQSLITLPQYSASIWSARGSWCTRTTKRKEQQLTHAMAPKRLLLLRGARAFCFPLALETSSTPWKRSSLCFACKRSPVCRFASVSFLLADCSMIFWCPTGFLRIVAVSGVHSESLQHRYSSTSTIVPLSLYMYLASCLFCVIAVPRHSMGLLVRLRSQFVTRLTLNSNVKMLTWAIYWAHFLQLYSNHGLSYHLPIQRPQSLAVLKLVSILSSLHPPLSVYRHRKWVSHHQKDTIKVGGCAAFKGRCDHVPHLTGDGRMLEIKGLVGRSLPRKF